MNKYVEKSLKVTGAFCAATGVVALSSLVSCGAAAGAVVEGFKAAGNTMKKMLTEETQTDVCTESKAENQADTDEMAVEEAEATVENDESV